MDNSNFAIDDSEHDEPLEDLFEQLVLREEECEEEWDEEDDVENKIAEDDRELPIADDNVDVDQDADDDDVVNDVDDPENVDPVDSTRDEVLTNLMHFNCPPNFMTWQFPADQSPDDAYGPALANNHGNMSPSPLEHSAGVPEQQSRQTERIVQRILLDPYHAMARVNVSAKHSMRWYYAQALSQAMFKWDVHDLREVVHSLITRGRDPMRKYWNSRHYFTRRVRRFIPPPKELEERLQNVFKTYGNMKDSKSGKPLFDKTTWAEVDRLLVHVRKGCLSDPPGIQLYEELPRDNHGLRRYLCLRGTNGVESLHQKLVRVFGMYNVGVVLGMAVLEDYRHIFNMSRMTK